MLRSCYSTQACFGFGFPYMDLEWYFVPPGTPFLPVPSCINSLNWVDRKDRVETLFVPGERPGFATYSKGQPPVWSANPTTYCGSASDWLGHGAVLSPPMQYEWSGRPVCCRSGVTSTTDLSTSVTQVSPWNTTCIVTGGGGVILQRASALPFSVLSNLLTQGNINPPWTVDLLHAIPLNPDTLADCSLCSFPGYAQQQMYLPIVIPDPGANNEGIPAGPFHFASTGTGGSAHTAVGYVVADASGNVLWWYSDGNTYDFSKVGGAYLDVTFTVYANYDYA